MRGGNLAPIGTTLLICLPPALLLFTLFVALPMGEAAWYSFFRWNGYGTPDRVRGPAQLRELFVQPRVPHRARQQPADHRGLAGHPAAAGAGDGGAAGRAHPRRR